MVEHLLECFTNSQQSYQMSKYLDILLWFKISVNRLKLLKVI